MAAEEGVLYVSVSPCTNNVDGQLITGTISTRLESNKGSRFSNSQMFDLMLEGTALQDRANHTNAIHNPFYLAFEVFSSILSSRITQFERAIKKGESVSNPRRLYNCYKMRSIISVLKTYRGVTRYSGEVTKVTQILKHNRNVEWGAFVLHL